MARLIPTQRVNEKPEDYYRRLLEHRNYFQNFKYPPCVIDELVYKFKNKK